MLLALLLACHVSDGDTLRCGDERIRLTGIDAPELRGHCRHGRKCAPGNGEVSKHSLEEAMASGPLTIDRLGHDKYGRTLGVVRAGSLNLACWQLARHQAIYKVRWDNGRHVQQECRP